MSVYRTGSISLPCSSHVHLEVERGGEIGVVIDGSLAHTVDAEVADQLAAAFREVVPVARREAGQIRFAAHDVVLTGRFYGTRKDLARRLTRAGACVRDYVHSGVILIKGDLPAGGTFKSRTGDELGVRTMSAREAHQALTALGL